MSQQDVFIIPTSFAQQRLWFLDQLEPGSHVYNIPVALNLSGHLELDVLRRSLEEVVRRHEALRTRFAPVDGEPMQVIEPSASVELPVIDLRHLDAEERQRRARALADQEVRRGFDLSADQLIRVSVVRLSDEEHLLLLTLHHMVADAWSMNVLVREVSTLYDAFSRGERSPLPELPVQYADYAVWQREHLTDSAMERQLAYWERQLSGAPPVLTLPADRPRPAVKSFDGGRYPLTLSAELTERLRGVSRREGLSLFMTLLAAFDLLLSRLSGQQDICVGTPVAGRPRPETRDLIGFFVNTLVLRSDLSGDPTLGELLARVRETCLGAYAHQEAPFERVVERLRPERSLSHSPLFQVMLALDNTPRGRAGLGGLRVRREAVESGAAKYDLALLLEEGAADAEGGVGGVAEAGRGVGGAFYYDRDLFEAETVGRMAGQFRLLLEALASADPSERLSSLPRLTEVEQELLAAWNETGREYERNVCLHHLFERQAARSPEAVAVAAPDATLTYAELDALAERLARRLRARGVGPEARVGVLMRRSAGMVAALLGVLKAGGAYVPLDAAYPGERLAFMVKDSGAALVLAEEATLGAAREAAGGGGAEVLVVGQEWGDGQGQAAESRGAEEAGGSAGVTAGNLAYVIYTSGSTGRPKGVAVSHRNLLNLISWHARAFRLSHRDRTTHLAAPSFDAATWEVWPSLTSGAALLLPDEEVRRSPERLRDWLVAEGVTISFLPTPLAEQALGLAWPAAAPLRLLLTGGDRLQHHPPAGLPFALVNNYGPTECTVVATSGEVGAGPNESAPPIGRPIANTRLHLLDSRMEPVAVGAAGEVYVAGAGVARGYLGRPALTAERFVPDPYSGEAGARLYRTGDVARWRAGGELEFLGRRDEQVKVRGFRIELGEIEATLLRHPRVREAAALAWEERPGEKSLAAYVTTKGDGEGVSPAELRRFLQGKLPAHAVPSAYVLLDELPLTPNGKIDRRALPPPDRESREGADAFVAPGSVTEELVAGIWGQLFDLDRVGVNDNFFELGGHSLVATQVVARLRETFHVEVPLRVLFEQQTVAALADYVESARRKGGPPAPPLKPVERVGALPLSFAQQRLWFLDQFEPGSAFYNLPGAARLRGSLNLPALERSLNEVVRRHEVLRTTFEYVEGSPVQIIAPPSEVSLPLTNLTSLPAAEREAEAGRLIAEESQRPFDLGVGPLLRVSLLRLDEREHVLLFTMHHIISDGWSIGVLVREVAALYDSFSRGEQSPLAELPVQYADYAAWQSQRAAAFEEQLNYWEHRLAGAPELLTLPTDRPRPFVQRHRGASLPFPLSAELVGRLRGVSRREGLSLFMTLLTAFDLLLSRFSGQQDICVGTPVAGRRHEESEKLIGLFINAIVLRTDLSGDPTLGELMARVRETCLGAYAHQEAPFERVVERLRPGRSLSHSPLFQVMLTLDNTPHQALKLEGLTVERVRLAGETAKFDLTFAFEEDGEGLGGIIEYNSGLFSAETVLRMAGQFRLLLEALASADPSDRLSSLPRLTEVEQELLAAWNETGREYERNVCLHHLFERQAAQRPEAVAVVGADATLTYAELDALAERLARRLRARGVGPESRVGVLMRRSAGMVAALLGVLKAGGAYVPLDAAYPGERLAFMVKDSGAALVLAEEATLGAAREAARGSAAEVVLVEEELRPEAHRPSREGGGAAEPTAGNLAYVIYTSGSTGKPKGVAIPHCNVLNLLTALDEKLGGEEPGVWLALTSISFDISVLELFWSLARGFKVVLQQKIDLAAKPAEPAVTAAERVMDFSLFYFASNDGNGNEDIYELLLEGAKFGDAHGFSAVWTPERHFHAFGGMYPNPSVTSAAVAAVTRRIEIRAGSVVIPLHDPLRVAEEWAMVDNLSKGRVAISFASGWHPDDFVLAPDTYEDRHEVMYRNIDIVRRLWRGEAVTRRGGGGNDVEVRIHPRPVQPELRFWITAAGNPETFRTAGRIGANLLTHLLGQSIEELEEKIRIYRAAWREHGHGPGEGRVTLMLHTFVGRDLEAVRETVRAPFSGYLRSSISLLRHSARSLGRDLDSQRLTESDMDAILGHAFDRYFETSALMGTPETCLRLIERLKAIDVDEVGCLIDFGVRPSEVLSHLPHLDELRRLSNRKAEQADGGDYTLPGQIREHGATHLQFTPSMARMLMAEPESAAALQSLETVLVGGEALPDSLARQLRENLPAKIFNMYGPTETTVWSTVSEVEEAEGPVLIGRPLANTTVYILGPSMRPVPVGVPGELYIGGAGVARGYLGRPALTAERFVPDPFSAEPGGRLYRTGDVARYLPDGRLEFLGRVDNQVKIRGHRIETGEIETLLRQHPGVREAVVIAREDATGESRLLAYVVPSAPRAAAREHDGQAPAAGKEPRAGGDGAQAEGDGAEPEGDALSPGVLRDFLERKLPAYMLPAAYVFLDELPLTANMKVNLRALPDPESLAAGPRPAYVAPESSAEQTIHAIWREVLKVEHLGVHDNFFEVGGTSMLVVQVNNRLREAFDKSIPIFEMFRHPTISSLARLVGGEQAAKPSFQEAQTRAGKQAEVMSQQKRLMRARQTRRPPGGGH